MARFCHVFCFVVMYFCFVFAVVFRCLWLFCVVFRCLFLFSCCFVLSLLFVFVRPFVIVIFLYNSFPCVCSCFLVLFTFSFVFLFCYRVLSWVLLRIGLLPVSFPCVVCSVLSRVKWLNNCSLTVSFSFVFLSRGLCLLAWSAFPVGRNRIDSVAVHFSRFNFHVRCLFY